jgi:hypothetical protein
MGAPGIRRTKLPRGVNAGTLLYTWSARWAVRPRGARRDLAWRQRPLDERRDALDRLVEANTLSEGGAQVAYRVKDLDAPSMAVAAGYPPEGACPGSRYQAPYRPPLGSGERKVGFLEVGVKRTAGR